MLTPFETLEKNEAAMIAEMTDILRRKMERDYRAGGTRRDAHPKATGLLRGSFVIEPDLPAEWRVGVFARARSYDCWLRASSASGKVRSDAIEAASPFVKLATVQIPTQEFRTRQRAELAEVLSFSPGHALPAHAPLGGLNRARIKIYKALSAFRHERDERTDLA